MKHSASISRQTPEAIPATAVAAVRMDVASLCAVACINAKRTALPLTHWFLWVNREQGAQD